MDGRKRREVDGSLLIALFVMGVIASILGSMMAWRTVGSNLDARRAQPWRETKGVVEHAWLTTRRIDSDNVGSGPGRTRSRSTSYVSDLDVRYVYEVSGVRHVGTRVSMGFRPAGAGELQGRFRPGAEVAVFFDPGDPSESCLIRAPVEFPVYHGSAAGLVLAIAIALFATFGVQLRRYRR